MRDLGNIAVCIPARKGSKRVKNKNLRELCGKPLIQYTIDNAKLCFETETIYINSDSSKLLQLGKNSGIQTYKRSKLLASDKATGDEFTYDFIKSIRPDTCIMLNPVCPLIDYTDIRNSVSAYQNSSCDTLISCETTQMQAFCGDQWINIDVNKKLQPSQKNPIISILNWGITIWNAKSFLSKYERTGSAYLGKDRLLFPLKQENCLKISTESDFKLAEIMIKGKGEQ